MNSVLQCLANTKKLLLFCLKDDLDNDLNTSTTSVMKGVLMRGLKFKKKNLLFKI
jgi:ubiquitin C-terminal hydrolase